jgi:hypothetical protein
MKKMLTMTALNRSGECTGSVPDLEFDGLVGECDVAELEVDADGGKGGVVVGLICEAREQAALAHSRVADEDQLEDVVVVRRCVCHCVLVLCGLYARCLAACCVDAYLNWADGLMYSPYASGFLAGRSRGAPSTATRLPPRPFRPSPDKSWFRSNSIR